MKQIIVLRTRLRYVPLVVASLLLCAATAPLAAPPGSNAFLQLRPIVVCASPDLDQNVAERNLATECAAAAGAVRTRGIPREVCEPRRDGDSDGWSLAASRYDSDLRTYHVAAEAASQPGPMVYNGVTVDDDGSGGSDGNGDGVVDCGESIELWVELFNDGVGTATGVNAAIATSDPYVTFTEYPESRYPDLPPLASRSNADDFDFQVALTAPNGHMIHFDLYITASNGGPWLVGFDLPVTCPCVYPATCYVDQAYAGEPGGYSRPLGLEDQPFIKFTEGMEMAEAWGLRRDVEGEVMVSPGHYAAVGVYTYPITITAPAGEVYLEGFPELRGDTSCSSESPDCTPCVQGDIVEAFQRLRTHGEILAFHLAGYPEPEWDNIWQFHRHWQGVQRLSVGSGNYVVVARDDVDGASTFFVAEMASRDSGNRRYRSNRLDAFQPFAWTAPPAQDVIVAAQTINDRDKHAGGPQAMGEVLITDSEHAIHLFDVSNPEEPRRRGSGPIIERAEYGLSGTSIAKLQDGRFLIVGLGGGAKALDFYISETPDLLSDYSNFDRWERGEVTGDTELRYLWDNYQTANLVSECDTGELYLIATGNLDVTSSTWIDGQCFGGYPCYPDGEDWASLYRIGMRDVNNVALEKVAEFHAYCTFEPWGQHPLCNNEHPEWCLWPTSQCNFDAAAGAYVDDGGRLVIYATEHDNKGPSYESDGSVRMMEFRSVPHGPCDTIEEAWVELYEDDRFAGQGRMIDYRDRSLEDYSDYHQVGLEYFGGEASSARWCIPDGWGYRLYEDSSYGGETLLIVGVGESRELADLDDYGFGNRVSSSAWVDLSTEGESSEGEVTIQ